MPFVRIYPDKKEGDRTNKENCNKIEISPFHTHTMGDVGIGYARTGSIYEKHHFDGG